MAAEFIEFSDGIDWGDVTHYDGLTAFTIGFWLREQSNGGGRIVHKWNGGGSFVINSSGGGNLLFAMSGPSGAFGLAETTSAGLRRDIWTHVAILWFANGPFVNSHFILFDGVIQPTNTSIDTGTISSVAVTGDSFQFGFELAEGASSFVGELAEYGAWNTTLFEDEILMLAAGKPASQIKRNNLISDIPLNAGEAYRDNVLTTQFQLFVGGITRPSFAHHPPKVIEHMSGERTPSCGQAVPYINRTDAAFRAPEAAGGFQAAWATGSNVLINPWGIAL